MYWAGLGSLVGYRTTAGFTLWSNADHSNHDQQVQFYIFLDKKFQSYLSLLKSFQSLFMISTDIFKFLQCLFFLSQKINIEKKPYIFMTSYHLITVRYSIQHSRKKNTAAKEKQRYQNTVANIITCIPSRTNYYYITYSEIHSPLTQHLHSTNK